ncbi:MAG: ABC transporter substrate-binding protein [Actinomycetota bacterium]
MRPAARRILPIALAAVALALAGCTAADDPTIEPGRPPPTGAPDRATDRSGRIVVGLPGEPPTLDPYSPVASELTWEVVRPVYPSLYRLLPDGNVEPALATSIDAGRTSARVTIRQAFWSDGSPITARDVVRSVGRARSPSGFARIDSARARGRRVVVLRGRVRSWQRALATVAFVLPDGKVDRSIAGGPLRIKSMIPGLELVYGPNRKWWGSVGVREVVVRYTRGVEMLLALLERRRIDVASIPTSVNLEERLDELGLEHAAALGWDSIYLDIGGAGFSDSEVASVFASIDREVIQEGLIRDDGRITSSLDPAPGPESSKILATGRRDSLPTGTIQLATALGDELLEIMQRIVQTQVQSGDLEVELVSIEPSDFYGDWMIDDPTDLALRRASGAPGERGHPPRGESLPLFHVERVGAWLQGVAGIRPNPTYDGLLWNVEEWRATS